MEKFMMHKREGIVGGMRESLRAVLSILLSAQLVQGQGVGSLGFKRLGDACSESPECNRILWFECINGFCNCTAPGDTVYDPRFRRCFGRLGTSCFQYGVGPYCQPGLFCNLNGSPVQQTVETRNLYPFRGVCVETLTPPVPKPPPPPPPVQISGLGGPCGQTATGLFQCGDGLICIEGRCQCNPEAGQFYIPEEPFCRIQPGAPCNPNWQAQCRADSDCLPGKDEGTFFCQCKAGTVLDPDNQCRPDYLSPCAGGPTPCRVGKFLDCLDGVCICGNPLHQRWDKAAQICTTLSNSVCNDVLPPCTEHSDCVAGRCLCREGHYETSSRTCKLRINYGFECKGGECDETTGMVCRNGKCVCVDPLMQFDEKRLICNALPGDICGQIQFNGIDKPVSVICPTGFICGETSPGAFRCTLPN